MIVRILGLGQWTMEPEQLLELNDIDEAVEKAVAEGDRKQLRKELQRLVDAVRSNGQEVPDDLIVESDLVLPDVDATLDEVKKLLESTSEYYGLVPDTEVDLESIQNEGGAGCCCARECGRGRVCRDREVFFSGRTRIDCSHSVPSM